jgi:glycosyltransferase involved in cell wall biosynthesis
MLSWAMPMRICQVAPLHESVPPKYYGGTERVVSWLTEELVRQGHDVTLFASGDSRTRARLVPGCPRSLRLDDRSVDPMAHHLVMLEQVSQVAHEFDVIHYHVDYLHYPLSRRCAAPQLTTLHGRLDIPDLAPVYREFAEMPVVSISSAQRRPLPDVNWRATVHHGLPVDQYRPGDGDGGYLAFLGRISPEKRVDHAIEIARRAGMPIRIAAKVDRADREYFEERIVPLLRQPHVECLGEISDGEKQDFLGRAAGLLFPIDWEEPFGLVMIEALACGTPVVAFRRGAVTEIIDHGATGFVVADVAEASEAVRRLGAIDRRRCRDEFERQFTSRRMAADYLRLYAQSLKAVPLASAV